MYIVTDLTGSQYRTKNLSKALRREHFVNLSYEKYDKYNKKVLKEVRTAKRGIKKLYEKKRLNNNKG